MPQVGLHQVLHARLRGKQTEPHNCDRLRSQCGVHAQTPTSCSKCLADIQQPKISLIGRAGVGTMDLTRKIATRIQQEQHGTLDVVFSDVGDNNVVADVGTVQRQLCIAFDAGKDFQLVLARFILPDVEPGGEGGGIPGHGFGRYLCTCIQAQRSQAVVGRIEYVGQVGCEAD